MKSVKTTRGVKLKIIYVRVRDVIHWEDNPKIHDMPGIKDSIRKHGFRDAPIWDETLGAIPAGNGRSHALYEMEQDDDPLPLGIVREVGTGYWCMPIQVGIDAPTVDLAESFAIDHNNLTMQVGDLTTFDVAEMWENTAYFEILERLKEQDAMPVSVDGDTLEFLREVSEARDAMPRAIESLTFNEDEGAHLAKVIITVNDVNSIEDAFSVLRLVVEQHPEWEANVTAVSPTSVG
jgi:hypothetical protein